MFDICASVLAAGNRPFCIYQELNAKAETKFIKLKAQAKAKIAKLQEELQQLKDDSSVGMANTSQDVGVVIN